MSSPSPRARLEVGEIDTRAPFQSVRAAVSLFGERVSSSGKSALRKAKSLLKENELTEEEARFLLAQDELSKLKEKLKNAESTKAQALEELISAKRAVEELTNQLNTVNELKNAAEKATEEVKRQAEIVKDPTFVANTRNDVAYNHELDCAREQYVTISNELDAAKQKLSSIRNDFQASMDAKVSALQQEAEAKRLSDAKTEKAIQLSEEIAVARASLTHLKLTSVEAQEQESKTSPDEASSQESHRRLLAETEKQLVSLKKEFNPDINRVLEAKLAETNAEIGTVQKEIEVATVKTELDSAKEVLHRVAEEESSLRFLVEALKLELEALKKEHSVLKQKDLETESIARDLNIKLQNCTAEIEAAMIVDSKAGTACDDLATLQQLSLDSRNAKMEAEVMNKAAEELRSEAESTTAAFDEAKKKVQVAMNDVAAAEAAEVEALNHIRYLSEKKAAMRALISETKTSITISREEYESLSRKVEECKKLADVKVATAMSQVEAARASENEAINRMEAARKEMEDLELAIEEALKRAEMAESAKRAGEDEMRRWREKEQKKAAEAASRLLMETKMSPESLPPRASFSEASSLEKVEGNDRVGRLVSKKKPLKTFGRMFHKKRSQSLSSLPGELHV